jgi:hypothetical protein
VPVYITNIRTRQANNPLTRLPGPATVALRPFATDRQSAVRQFCVRVFRPEPARLLLEYDLHADPAQVRIEGAADVARTAKPTDGLWHHTCMELFAGDNPPGAYVEFNLAPDGRWAAYRFSGYRAGMAPLTGIRPPHIELQTQSGALLLRADIALPADLAAAQLQLGIAAVVENHHGQLSYWALRHTRDRPDFHHPDGFAFEI